MPFLDMANSGPMYLLAIVVVFLVLTEAIVFLVRAYKEGKHIGMDTAVLKKAITSSAVFSILPSVGILLGVIALSGSLGVPLPWIRLSIIGALHYETMAADVAMQACGLAGTTSADLMTGEIFASIAMVMTVGIIWGVLFVLLFYKKFSVKLNKVTSSNPKVGNIVFASLFIGMVTAYVAQSVAGWRTTGSPVAFISMVVAAVFAFVFDILIKKCHIKWLENFAVSLSMLFGMGGAILSAYLLA